MTTFYKNFLALCYERGMSPSGVAKSIGLSNAAASGWKSGKLPNSTTIYKLADFFNVPFSTLTAENTFVFYEKFLKLCSQKGVKPSAVARALGINKSAVSNWKSRKNNPSDITVQRIADYFDVSVDYLIGKGKSPSATADGLLVTDLSEVTLLHMFRTLDAAAKARVMNVLNYEYATSVGDDQNNTVSQNA